MADILLEPIIMLDLLSEPKILASIITAVPTFFIALAAGWFAVHKYKEDKREKEYELIKIQLNEFYGPLLSYLDISQTLYMILEADKPEGFILFPYLLNKDQAYNGEKLTLTTSDHELIKEILGVFKKVENLILKNNGFIEDEKFKFNYYDDNEYNKKVKSFEDLFYDEMKDLSLLSRMLVNNRLLHLAYENKLTVDRNHLHEDSYALKLSEIFTFPKVVNKEIRRNIKSLQQRLKD